jgi:hypothetical protein
MTVVANREEVIRDRGCRWGGMIIRQERRKGAACISISLQGGVDSSTIDENLT